MYILVITHDTSKAGSQLVLLNVMEFMKKKNIEMKILCLSRGSGKLFDRFQKLGEIQIYEDLNLNLKEYCKNITCIYGNTVVSGRIYSVLNSIIPNIPIITHFHELEMSIQYYAKDCIEDTLKYSNHIIACSEAVKNNLINNHHFPNDKITIVHASVIPTNIPILNPNQKFYIRERENLSTEKFCIVGCGVGMARRKGIDIFYQIYERLNIKQNIAMYWIGDFADDDPLDNYGNYKNLKNMKGIEILGIQDDPISIISACDLFILPSREDPFPLVCLEAAECGLPTICFQNSGGMPEFINSELFECGFSVSNLDEFVEKIEFCIDNPSQLQKLGENARNNFLENYTIEKTTPKIVELLNKIELPIIHIILPNFNHGKYLKKRLDSIVNQTYTNWDLLILDDCSTDNSMDIISEYLNNNFKQNIQCIRNEVNSKSTFKQWIKGLNTVNEGEIVWIAESDDYSHPNFLYTMVNYFRDNNVKLAYCDSHIVDKDDVIIGNYLETDYLSSISTTKWNNDYILDGKEELLQGLGIKNTILNASSMLFRKPDISSIYDILSNMRICGDWLFEIFCIQRGKIAYSNKRYNYHRRHNESVLGKNEDRENKYLTLFKEMKTIHKYVLKSLDFNYEFYKKIISYVNQQYKDLSLERNLSYYYPIKVGFMGLKESESENVEYVLKTTGNNTGNLLFSETSKRLIDNPICDLSSEDADILFFTCANWLNPNSDYQFFADLIIKRNIPCICIGLGAQSDSENEFPVLKNGTINFLNEVSKRSSTILVRGNYSKKVCEHYGINNVEVGGCVSIFYNDDLKLGQKLEEKYLLCIEDENKKILYNIDLNFTNIDNTAKNGTYILQNEEYLMRLVNGETIDTKIAKSLEKYNIKNMHYFSNLNKWSEFVKNYDFAIGNRIHGTIMCLQNYVPSICNVIDTRTKELCETLKVPYKDIIFDGKNFDENRKFLAKKYFDLFKDLLIPSKKLLNFL
jgi:glycosyltransferase involved in cell wall biosynthesis